MSEQDDDADFAADEAARISTLQRMAPAAIWLQVDPEGDACSSEWSLLDGATWCSDKINSTDVEYVRADLLLGAVQAVIDRWDTPLWKDAPATAEYINRLRDAIAKVKP